MQSSKTRVKIKLVISRVNHANALVVLLKTIILSINYKKIFYFQTGRILEQTYSKPEESARVMARSPGAQRLQRQQITVFVSRAHPATHHGVDALGVVCPTLNPRLNPSTRHLPCPGRTRSLARAQSRIRGGGPARSVKTPLSSRSSCNLRRTSSAVVSRRGCSKTPRPPSLSSTSS